MFITGQTNPEVIDCLLCLIFTTWTLKLEILKPLKCLCIFALPNETASVVQWISHSPCDRRFDPGLLQKHLLKPISRLSLRVLPGQQNPQKTTSKYWSRPEKTTTKNVTSVVQWLSHLPCKPGVAGSIPGFSKHNNKNQPPG